MNDNQSNRKIIQFTDKTIKDLQMLELHSNASKDEIINHILTCAGKLLLERLYHDKPVDLANMIVVYQNDEVKLDDDSSEVE